ncbi:putative zinc-binding metallopeptidase [Methylonatrum kenyense]|uniref:zinc-binding metallopeptidase family protein n=1 Tax=Methylonatrum kenyense TaxID=455253 RepID=UPI0020BF9D74|nr:putative zinc-binding metallopeptidase [Methylonatrum kenyense]MCK8514790.1 putative zinc-binding metallopeptidase [Methylonatrum kenyense]
MRRFSCQCGNTLYFENSACLRCGRTVGFVPQQQAVRSLEPVGDGLYSVDGRHYRMCLHYVRDRVCNWMIPEADPEPFCEACRLNEIIPDLSQPENHLHWQRLETAKRHLLYQLMTLGLPLTPRSQQKDGLGFAFMEDDDNQQVLTGHAGGLITINVREADSAYRETMRKRLGEPYRTLLGHFRHESGHFYWDRLIATNGHELSAFRDLFGDERADYADAIARHYAGGGMDWPHHVISAYAAAHPWEDWAETWAHYLLIDDTLETAVDYDLIAALPDNLNARLETWRELSLMINALGGSLGMPTLYPFVYSDPVIEKLEFIHALLERQVPLQTYPGSTGPSPAPTQTGANPRTGV